MGVLQADIMVMKSEELIQVHIIFNMIFLFFAKCERVLKMQKNA